MKNIGNAIVMFIMGLIFIAAGACVGIYLAVDCELTCARLTGDQGTCRLIEKNLAGEKVREIQLANIQAAEVVKSCHTETRSNKGKRRTSSKRTTCSYSVKLNLKDGGKLGISGPGGSNDTTKPEAYANQINSFVSDFNLNDLKVEYNEAQTVYIIAFAIMGFGGIFCLIGIFMFIRGMV